MRASRSCGRGSTRRSSSAGSSRSQWSRIGSVQLFCSKPYRTPAEAKDAKVWAWEGDPKSVDAYRAAGLHPVVLSATDIVPSLQTGMIDCIPNVPLYVLTARLFDKAKYMLDVPWSYMIGATLVRKETWEKIPADLRPKLLAIAVELGKKVDEEVQRLNVDAVGAMQKQGLKVVQADPARGAPRWRSPGRSCAAASSPPRSSTRRRRRATRAAPRSRRRSSREVASRRTRSTRGSATRSRRRARHAKSRVRWPRAYSRGVTRQASASASAPAQSAIRSSRRPRRRPRAR